MTRRPKSPQPLGWRSAAVAFGVCVARGGNQVALKMALTGFAPLWTAFGRMVVAALTVLALSRRERIALAPRPGEVRPLALLGLLFTLQIGILHWGADLTSPAYAVVLINTNPIFASLIAHFFVVEDRMTWRRAAGLAIAFGSVCLVFTGRPDPRLAAQPLLGNSLIVFSALLVGARTVYTQQVVQRIEPERAVFAQMAVSLPAFAAGALLWGSQAGRDPFQWQALAAIAYQGVIVGGVALVIWVHLLRRHPPAAVSVFSFATPVAGVFLSEWLFAEAPGPRLWAGLAGVLCGVWFAAQGPGRPPAAVPKPLDD
jgi:drug/metabolite transporter (DMT)-like permease